MKNFKVTFTFVLLLLFGLNNAQKIGVVDTDYILNKLPQYKEAEARLNSQIDTWQSELQNLQSEYERKKSAFESEKVLLIGDQLKLREKEVVDLDKNVKTTTSLRFGANGEITKLRTNLVLPFQDQIWNAIKTMSEKNGLGIVLDKSNNISVIFLQKKYDFTDKVLDILLKGTDKKEKTNSKK
ncbi:MULTISPECIES: OmpH family outer membrane protein [Chryseobacterium]|jgi:outer membrane protein|uniref:Outer membrane protein n=1 Tax=Chryseobacterium rhizosphaerae TaxID=395937 RepID=A0AAE4C273_9FLAO|nr:MULTISPECIES: OmpH family outer membrane protein [Chryseobacterium]MBL3549344.1 OmpH family outer membrane protein [Chryseobacterium sp. KMC2]MDC8102899.1 OmpH family outer membrane protein [Chryseobacterium rhizosphaerae]MDR6526293.1 outer membrane protein [Chryseobacterium rhizosphaerae]MDR6545862.1 outer membrane protein [Chryseobacterium rhizosphaerae]REC74233.1 OmpH family outer membrane protein [Chryseobacterium rhizosphaerae]